jgi:hypothetical protein
VLTLPPWPVEPYLPGVLLFLLLASDAALKSATDGVHMLDVAAHHQPTGGSSASSSNASWVTSSFNAQTIDGVTVYDLTRAR